VSDTDSVLWTVRDGRGRLIECIVRFAMGGVQVEILSDGFPLISRVFPSGDEALAWAEEEREAWGARAKTHSPL
jgi:hypothetical protein